MTVSRSSDGWKLLNSFSGDWNVLHEVAMGALNSLQSCLSGTAVHGDLNPGNLLVRCASSIGSDLGLTCTRHADSDNALSSQLVLGAS